jgi:hypothetical protein
MSGSILAAVITPIVVMPVLAGWLALLYYVGEHPLWPHQIEPGGYQLDQAAPQELPGQPPDHPQPGVPGTLLH